MEQAVEVLAGDGLVALPTETVYGLAANALSELAVAKVFAVKNRPRFDPLICHVADRAGADALVDAWSEPAQILADRFWPGPLTLVVPKKPVVPDLVTAGSNTVGVRVPAHPLALHILRAFGGPLAAPSANPFTEVSPTTAAHVRAQLGDRVDLIIDGGPCVVGLESTIVMALPEHDPVLLRPGGIPLEAIEAAVGSVNVPSPTELKNASPGRQERHYAPQTPLIIESRQKPDPRVGRLAFRAAHSGYGASVCLSPQGDLDEAAARLFAAIRFLDGGGWDKIEAEPVPEKGLGRAIMDRLRRAEAKRS